MSARIDPGSVRDPDWLLAGFDVAADRFQLAHVSRQTYRDSAFLDHRIKPLPSETMSLNGTQVDALLKHSRLAQSAWIFHTGFCCSTLLASCLDHPGSTLVLREPLVLSRLAHAKRTASGKHAVGQQTASFEILTERVIGLCERNYAGESLLIKPSNFANNLIGDCLPSKPPQPQRKAILMSSSLDALLVSILKKSTEAEASLSGFLQALLQDSDYLEAAGLLSMGLTDGPSAMDKLTLLQQSVVFWHCQRHLLQQRLAAAGNDWFMPLSMERFLAEPEAALADVSRFLGLGLSVENIQQTVESGAFRRHSKQAVTDYGPDFYRREQQQIREHFAQEISEVLSWAGPLLQRLPVEPFDDFEPA
jgi:hypothetical protein